MTKNLVKTFLIIFALVAAIIVNSAFAGEVKSTESKSSTVNANEDPDLKLSIEELRKKYPIDWLEKKYGNFDNPECTGSPYDEGYEEERQSNLVCTFASKDKRKTINDFSLSEIKSAFIKKAYSFDQESNELQDPRINEIRGIVIEYFILKDEHSLTYKERKLKNFIFSDKILNQILNSSSCKYLVREFRISTRISCSK